MSTSQRDPVAKVQQVVCGSCQSVNSVDRRFCGRCGQRLWEPCVDCGTPNAADQQFCGHCGVNVEQALERRVDALKSCLRRCQTLCDEGRYLEAAASLESAEKTDDPRLEPLVAEIQAKLERIPGERLARVAEVAPLVEQARQAMAEFEHARALELLEQIPRGLRDQTISQALQAARSATEEVQELTTRIKTLLRNHDLDELLPHVNRLLELRPHDLKLAQLATQLRQRQQQQDVQSAERCLAMAKKQLLEGQYAQAAECLAAVDDQQLSAEQRKLYDIVMELDWLLCALRQEPYVHANLPAIVQRWQKLRPQDPQPARLADQLRKRLAVRPKDARFALTWAQLPEVTALPYPLQWWRSTAQVRRNDQAETLELSASRFMVAYGLALQGLSASQLRLNLLPQRNTTLRQRLATLGKQAAPQAVWGCDLGHSGLKALLLRRDKDTGDLEIANAVFVPHASAPGNAADDKAVTELLHETMSAFVAEHVPEPTAVVLGFSGPRSLGRTFEIPYFKGKKAADAIAYEARMQIPIPAEHIVYDWHAWPTLNEQTRFQRVTLLAARREHVEQVVNACAGLPLNVIAVQSICLALYNAAFAEFFAEPVAAAAQAAKPGPSNGAKTDLPPSSAAPLAILDVGADSSSIVVVAPNLVRHRSLPLGTQRLDRALMSRFRITHQQAQQLRHQPASARWMYQVDEVVREVFGELTGTLQRTLQAYAAEGIQIDRLLVTGGGSEQLGLMRQLIYAEHAAPRGG